MERKQRACSGSHRVLLQGWGFRHASLRYAHAPAKSLWGTVVATPRTHWTSSLVVDQGAPLKSRQGNSYTPLVHNLACVNESVRSMVVLFRNRSKDQSHKGHARAQVLECICWSMSHQEIQKGWRALLVAIYGQSKSRTFNAGRVSESISTDSSLSSIGASRRRAHPERGTEQYASQTCWNRTLECVSFHCRLS
jgi:hypothetical protein